LKNYTLLSAGPPSPTIPLEEFARVSALLSGYEVTKLAHYSILAAPGAMSVARSGQYHTIPEALIAPAAAVLPDALIADVLFKLGALLLRRGSFASVSFYASRIEVPGAHPLHTDIFIDYWGRCIVGKQYPVVPEDVAHQQLAAWALNGGEGAAALTIANCLFPEFAYQDSPQLPTNLGAFMRCESLLERVLGARDRLQAVSARLPEWGPVVDEWPILCAAVRKALDSRDASHKAAAKQILQDCVDAGRALAESYGNMLPSTSPALAHIEKPQFV